MRQTELIVIHYANEYPLAMDFLLRFFSIIGFCTTAILIARAFKPASVPEFLLVGFTALSSIVITSGYILSSFDQLAVVAWWAALSVLWLILSIVILGSRGGNERTDVGSLLQQSWMRIRLWYGNLSIFEKGLLLPPLITLVLLGCINVMLVVFVAPHNWDSLAYHLPRMAYYLQHGNLNFFEANYPAQVVHPKNSTILFLYTYLVSGRNENLIQLVQYLSYWVSVVSVYGISRRLGGDITASVLSAAVFGLLIEGLMQAVTTQNDLIWIVFLAVATYALVSYRSESRREYLILGAVAIALSLGVKATSVLAIPSVMIVAVYALSAWKQPGRASRESAVLIVAAMAGLSLFALPAGYYGNIERFGNPVAPPQVISDDSFFGSDVGKVMKEGSRNVLRYSVDFISLDGLPPSGIPLKAHRLLRFLPVQVLKLAGIAKDTSRPVPPGFDPQKVPAAHEDLSTWGALGFGLIWIAILKALLTAREGRTRVLALSAMTYVLAQSFALPYSTWNERYFLFAAVVGAPTIIDIIGRTPNTLWRAYLAGVVLVGCMCAVSAVILRPVSDPRGHFKQQDIVSLLRRDRMHQLTTNLGKFLVPMQQFEERVSLTATVAVCLPPSGFEYPLFGEKLTRTLIPINSFVHGVQPVPKEASFIVFSSELMTPLPEDEFLGEAYYLRRLRK